jgi:hypothetical protein
LLAVVTAPVLAQSPYLARVLEYRPAPGQFINSLPDYEEGDTEETLCQKAENRIAGEDPSMISLGGFGGYVTFAFDHPVENVPGHFDFRILANAFYSDANPNPEAQGEGGSCEPGIVFVAVDENGNGLPDDRWYELAGSEYFKSTTTRNYTITYHRPDADHIPDPDPAYRPIIDRSYILWTDNLGDTGYLERNSYHPQPYYPEWIADDSLVFTGTLLPDNAIDESGIGSYYVQYAYPWGYVDNHLNSDPRSCFNIDWAVDSEGKHVALEYIDFIRVQNAINQNCGWLGETSTEVAGATDLHLLGQVLPCPYSHWPPDAVSPLPASISVMAGYYTLTGRFLGQDVPSRPGFYIQRFNNPSPLTKKIFLSN